MQKTRRADLIIIVIVVSSLWSVGSLPDSAQGELTEITGYLTISPDVTIVQGNGVSYSFASAATLLHLGIDYDFIVLDYWLTIGANVSSGFLSNVLVEYGPEYVSWIGSVSDSGSGITYLISGFNVTSGYEVYKDGALILRQDPGSCTVTFSASGSGTYEVLAFDPAEIPEDSRYLMLVIGTAIAVLAIMSVASRRTRKGCR